jgi:hypothetical protein
MYTRQSLMAGLSGDDRRRQWQCNVPRTSYGVVSGEVSQWCSIVQRTVNRRDLQAEKAGNHDVSDVPGFM